MGGGVEAQPRGYVPEKPPVECPVRLGIEAVDLVGALRGDGLHDLAILVRTRRCRHRLDEIQVAPPLHSAEIDDLRVAGQPVECPVRGDNSVPQREAGGNMCRSTNRRATPSQAAARGL